MASSQVNTIFRSIPAGAGEPCLAAWTARTWTVYPRGRGGTSLAAVTALSAIGLSPRARGNHHVVDARRARRGSIPAGAGEPCAHYTEDGGEWVYPRGRGGTKEASRRGAQRKGLSPRARGNPQKGRYQRTNAGSIPAGAGEPGNGRKSQPPWQVYPRGRGGTTRITSGRGHMDGLSPRARGNQAVAVAVRLSARNCQAGLSPRARGNRLFVRQAEPAGGSIPAGAGEPGWTYRLCRRTTVYPRGRGGTTPRAARSSRLLGLSPRARGNRVGNGRTDDAAGSIPAGAGEPR